MKKIFVFVLIVSFLLVGCGTSAQPGQDLPQSAAAVQPTPAPIINETAQAPAAPTSAPSEIPSNPGEPIDVSFPSADGTMLSGRFYPPVNSNAPVVVLMHQFNMNQNQWDAIALWLQNAPVEQASMPMRLVSYQSAQTDPWQEQSWFPALPADFSVGVFTFTFRGCERGCQNMDREHWIADAQAALEKAASMPGVDASRIVSIGTSIGADAAVDACFLTLSSSIFRCVGVMSLSPGSYLDMPYPNTAQKIVEIGIPHTCFASQGDSLSASACTSFRMQGFTSHVDSGAMHGIMMVNPDQDTNILAEIRDFLVSGVIQ